MPYVYNEKTGKKTWRHGPAAPGLSKLETSAMHSAIFSIADGKTAQRLAVSGYLVKRTDRPSYYELTDKGKEFVAKHFPRGNELLEQAAIDAAEILAAKVRRERLAAAKAKFCAAYLSTLFDDPVLVDELLDAMERLTP